MIACRLLQIGLHPVKCAAAPTLMSIYGRFTAANSKIAAMKTSSDSVDCATVQKLTRIMLWLDASKDDIGLRSHFVKSS